jgi:transcriptional regulator with GAF, ATPase, and Fis domain
MTLEELKCKAIKEALKRNNGVIKFAARDLKINPRTITNFIKANKVK